MLQSLYAPIFLRLCLWMSFGRGFQWGTFGVVFHRNDSNFSSKRKLSYPQCFGIPFDNNYLIVFCYPPRHEYINGMHYNAEFWVQFFLYVNKQFMCGLTIFNFFNIKLLNWRMCNDVFETKCCLFYFKFCAQSLIVFGWCFYLS